jgi:hypothetical protein
MERPRGARLREFSGMSSQQHGAIGLLEALQREHLGEAVADIHPVGQRHHPIDGGVEVVEVLMIERDETMLRVRHPRELIGNHFVRTSAAAQRERR